MRADPIAMSKPPKSRNLKVEQERGDPDVERGEQPRPSRGGSTKVPIVSA
jgi:hypothetical protein